MGTKFLPPPGLCLKVSSSDSSSDYIQQQIHTQYLLHSNCTGIHQIKHNQWKLEILKFNIKKSKLTNSTDTV